MKYPGLSSLFTHLKVEFEKASQEAIDHKSLLYQLKLRNYDSHFRILEAELQIATEDGQPVATATLASYVRFSQSGPSAEFYQVALGADQRWLAKWYWYAVQAEDWGQSWPWPVGLQAQRFISPAVNQLILTNELARSISSAGGMRTFLWLMLAIRSGATRLMKC